MKVLFASDISFVHMTEFCREKAYECMNETAKAFENADFSMINLENVFGNRQQLIPIVKSGPNLISSADFLEYINVLNPTVVGLANNHAGDWGDEALLDTIDILHENGYRCIGAGKNRNAAYEPVYFEQDGEKAAVIAVCENEFGTATAVTAGSAGYSLQKVAQGIRIAKEKGFVPIIYFHGGNEYNPFPSPGKKELYRHFADLGAGAVVAMHTHCPQGYEVYNGVPIVYSMGNFFFPQESDLKSWYYGYMTELDIQDGRAELNIVPYKFNTDSHTILEKCEKKDFLEYMDYLNFVIADDELLEEYFDSWCIMWGIGAYAKNLKFSDETVNGGAESVKHLKNVFSCEAHNELINRTLQLIFDERVEKAKDNVEKIKSLQNMKLFTEKC